MNLVTKSPLILHDLATKRVRYYGMTEFYLSWKHPSITLTSRNREGLNIMRKDSCESPLIYRLY